MLRVPSNRDRREQTLSPVSPRFPRSSVLLHAGFQLLSGPTVLTPGRSLQSEMVEKAFRRAKRDENFQILTQN